MKKSAARTTAALALAAFGLTSVFSSLGQAAPKKPKPPAALDALVSALEKCAGNSDWTGMWSYDVKKFSAKKAMAFLKKDDGHCGLERRYSRSREEAADLFEAHILNNELTAPCIREELTADQREQAVALLRDPKNLGVFASLYEGGSEPEACDYSMFHIYRADGIRVQIEFNYTD